MSDTRALLNRVAEFRKRLEEMPRLISRATIGRGGGYSGCRAAIAKRDSSIAVANSGDP